MEDPNIFKEPWFPRGIETRHVSRAGGWRYSQQYNHRIKLWEHEGEKRAGKSAT